MDDARRESSRPRMSQETVTGRFPFLLSGTEAVSGGRVERNLAFPQCDSGDRRPPSDVIEATGVTVQIVEMTDENRNGISRSFESVQSWKVRFSLIAHRRAAVEDSPFLFGLMAVDRRVYCEAWNICVCTLVTLTGITKYHAKD
ncbi:hypothetical protein EVAR_21806_1 [Eumeta japonica]|uniref:Uncharacterized protein n=1 Tax=Eumeta variegata TaxID=151549 RepID=A0A4C1YJP1_EUMVA|nr:hypothetical protein EVAR_21806_1 [Eumeta japonica]